MDGDKAGGIQWDVMPDGEVRLRTYNGLNGSTAQFTSEHFGLLARYLDAVAIDARYMRADYEQDDGDA